MYSTFLGTSNNMQAAGIQVDANGDAFIVGSDVGLDLVNPIEEFAGGSSNVVVAEIDPSASTLLMATFLGGQVADGGEGIALDSNGAVYVTGQTLSFDFPVTQSAFQTMWGGQTDGFVTKIDPTTNAPAVAMGPFSLQFASQNIGSTSAAQTTISRNMGSAALTLSGKSVGPDFAETDDCGTTVAAASFCTFTVTFAPTVSGDLAEALTLTDNAQGGTQSVALTGTGTGSGPDFTVSAGNSQAAVSAGGAATYNLNVSPVGGSFSHSVTFACHGAPAFATCTVTPKSINPGSPALVVTVTVQTAGTVAGMQTPSGKRNAFLASWIFGPMGIFGVILLGANGRRKPQACIATVLMIMLLLLPGCSGSAAGGKTPGVSNTTPPGTYSLSLTAVSGTVQYVTKLALIVQ